MRASRTGLMPSGPAMSMRNTSLGSSLVPHAGMKKVSAATIARRERSNSPLTRGQGVGGGPCRARSNSQEGHHAAKAASNSMIHKRPNRASPPKRKAAPQHDVAPTAAHPTQAVHAAHPTHPKRDPSSTAADVAASSAELHDLVKMYKSLYCSATEGENMEADSFDATPAVAMPAAEGQSSLYDAQPVQKVNKAKPTTDQDDYTWERDVHESALGPEGEESEVAVVEEEEDFAAFTAGLDVDLLEKQVESIERRIFASEQSRGQVEQTAAPEKERPKAWKAEIPIKKQPKVKEIKEVKEVKEKERKPLYTDYSKQMERVQEELKEAQRDRTVLVEQNSQVESRCTTLQAELDILKQQHVDLHVSTQRVSEELISQVKRLLGSVDHLSGRVRELEGAEEKRRQQEVADEEVPVPHTAAPSALPSKMSLSLKQPEGHEAVTALYPASEPRVGGKVSFQPVVRTHTFDENSEENTQTPPHTVVSHRASMHEGVLRSAGVGSVRQGQSPGLSSSPEGSSSVSTSPRTVLRQEIHKQVC